MRYSLRPLSEQNSFLAFQSNFNPAKIIKISSNSTVCYSFPLLYILLLDWFSSHTHLYGDYLLPIVSVPGYSGERLYSHIRGRYKHFSRNLNNLGLAIGLNGFRLTSYVARHTMAMTHERILVAKVREYDYSTACGVCGSLLSLSQAVDIPSAVLLMKRTVPEFKSKNSPYEQYDLRIEQERQAAGQQPS